jgi:hypothetical protein
MHKILRLGALIALVTLPVASSEAIGLSGITYRQCDGGFVRENPNFCRRTSNLNVISWSDVVACTQSSLTPQPPATAVAVRLGLVWKAVSSNVVGNRVNDVTFYRDVGCTQPGVKSEYLVREMVATTAGTIIGEATDHVEVPFNGSAGRIYFTQSFAAASGNADINFYWIEGYYD